jgi:hypothetical protein
MIVFYKLIDFLELTFDHYSHQENNFLIKFSNGQSSKLTKFHLLFMNIP